MSVFGTAYEGVKIPNVIAGNLEGGADGLQRVDNQLGIIFSEFEETVAAFENQDAKELLDGGLDLYVTVCGLLQILESIGFNVQEGIQRVNDSNLTKFSRVIEKPLKDVDVVPKFNAQYGRYALIDRNGKYNKPASYKEVDLSGLYPAGAFQ